MNILITNFILNNLNFETIFILSFFFTVFIMIYFISYLGRYVRNAMPAKLDILIFSVFFISGILFLFFFCFAFSVAENYTLSNLDACTKDQLSYQLRNNEILLNKDVMESSSYCDAKRLKFENELRSGKIIESQINLIKSSEVKK